MRRRIEFGGGAVVLDEDGTPLGFTHPADARRRYLLDPTIDVWHDRDHGWGSGFVLTPAGAGRWQQPERTTWREDGVTTRHQPRPELSLDVVRRVDGPVLSETYTWSNTGDRVVRLTGLALNVPVRDVYDDALTSLERSCHAHVFVGGAWAWVLAEPMSATPPLLGLIVRGGALWAYSVESRNQNTSSNVRGHLLVHPTDHARNPQAFGGQPVITLAPGQEHVLTWEIGWYESRTDFLVATNPPAAPVELTAPVGETVRLGLGEGVTLLPAPGVRGAEVFGAEHGERYLDLERDGRRSRTAVAFLAPLRDLVEARVARLLDQHRPGERGDPDRYAFLAVDTRTGLRQAENGWPDWSPGGERIGMAVLVQEARRRGWGDPAAVDEALQGYARFARRRMIRPDGSVGRRGNPVGEQLRLYNTPWLAHFFATQFELYGAADDLDTAAGLLEASYSFGVADHLSIGHPEAVLTVAELLARQGDDERAAALRRALVDHAGRFAELGTDLPAHEVNYEQSMVAPLVTLLSVGHLIEPSDAFLAALRPSVRWLRAFGGPQPHVRLRDIGIRHWDGYWFGLDRLWGDTFPHYWSVLTAIALHQLPAELRDAETDRVARAIFAANLVDFTPTGQATCAYVLPSCVDGRPAHRADPLANDQDWALALALRTAGG